MQLEDGLQMRAKLLAGFLGSDLTILSAGVFGNLACDTGAGMAFRRDIAGWRWMNFWVMIIQCYLAL